MPTAEILSLKYLRLLHTFASVLQKKKLYARCFQGNPTNYISIERLWNVESDKIILYFANHFPNAAEAINAKMTDWDFSKFIGCQMRSLNDAK